LTYSYSSTPLFPTVYAWRVLVYNEDEVDLPLERVLDGGGNLDGTLDWEHRTQEDGSSQANLSEAYSVRLDEYHGKRLAAGERLAAYVATTITCPDERQVILLAWARCHAEWYLNGQRIEFLPMHEHTTPQPPFFRPTQESQLLRLRAGENSLVAVTMPSGSVRTSSGVPFWRLGAALKPPDGEVMNDLEYG
jgi:hypothetical protein